MTKRRASTFNLTAPNGLRSPCNLRDLDCWFEGELEAVEKESMRNAIRSVVESLPDFVEWPERALLLWRDCDRIASPEARTKYHKYPKELRDLIAGQVCKLDTRANGPAGAAFAFAGGYRPARFGSSNSWSIHHVYSGKFPVQAGRTLHACKSGLHFTQSAGLVAVHPIADAMADEFPFFAWRLRAESFRRFGYDPDGVFGEGHDGLGFQAGRRCEVVWPRSE